MTEQKNKTKKLTTLVSKAMGADRQAFRGEILRLGRENLSEEVFTQRVASLEKRIAASIRKRDWRRKHPPNYSFDDSLPITARKDEIIDAIKKHRVVVVSGDTGSGKTTQIPKFCLAAGRGIDGMIGCTQPRRIAATTVSKRIAEELGEELGASVGYKIRFQDKTGDNTFVKIMTDGILLAETQGDPYLNDYDTIIVDEAHERSLNIDFVLGILRTLLKKRHDLKLIITSATIDTEKFSKAFGNAPIIEVSGRMYPVDVRYQPLNESDGDTHVEAAAQAVRAILSQAKNDFRGSEAKNDFRGSEAKNDFRTPKAKNDFRTPGDILVFMPTEQDIRETCEIIDGMTTDLGISGAVETMPLFARLSSAEQSRVFSGRSGRKIIVSTNVAETSVTIPGIRYVVDTGLARISRYSPRSRTTSLPVTPISKSSADQRMGRCGRVQKGVCIRLYEEDDYQARAMFTLPEILRSNLAEVILRMISLRLGDVSDFPFVDKPADKSIRDGFDLLTELGAIQRNRPGSAYRYALTQQGRLMAKMPIDPRLSRMFIEAGPHGCVREIAVIASALSIQDPRERPAEKAGEADKTQGRFKDASSDFVTLINLWNAWHKTFSEVKTGNRMKKFCKTHFLSYKRMREWMDIHHQIAEILKENKMWPTGSFGPEIPVDGLVNSAQAGGGRYAGVHKSVLSGFLSNIAMKKEKNIYTAARNRETMIFPGSGLFNTAGDWIVASEMVETSRLFARTVANIDVAWLEELGRDQCKSVFLHPHWEKNRGEVVASEQVTLYGLIIVPNRPASYGPVDPDDASDIFIRGALIRGDVKRPLPFMKHNMALIGDIRDMEDRLRKRDILVDEHALFEFYKNRLDGIYSIPMLESYIKKKGGDGFLKMKKRDLYQYLPESSALSLFPDSITVGGDQFTCDYAFDPGGERDGVTLKVSADRAHGIPTGPLDWLVPGLLGEKITALVRGLPKQYRKQLVPVAETADTITKGLLSSPEMPTRSGSESLITALGNFIHEKYGVDIPASAWPMDDLPDHLRMRVEITGQKGHVIRAGRDKSVFDQAAESPVDPKAFAAAAKPHERTGLTRWDFGDIPDAMAITGKKGNTWTAYPGLSPDDTHVNLRLFPDRREASSVHAKGVAKLYTLLFSKDLKFLKKSLVLTGDAARHAGHFGGAKNFEKRLFESVVKELFEIDIRTEKDFFARAESVIQSVISHGKKKQELASGLLTEFHDAVSTISELERKFPPNGVTAEFFSELRESLERLVPDTFLTLYGEDRIGHLKRYVKAVAIRARRGVLDFEKDKTRAKEVDIHTGYLDGLLKTLSPSASDEKRAALEEYFWLIEEFKVSLFAQELKTPFPISGKRLTTKYREITRMV